MVLQSIKALIGAATEHISILPEHTLQLNFDTASADFDRAGNDLVISFEEGSVSIDNFFVVEGDELPSLVLVDGVEVSAHDFLSSMNPDMDLTTTLAEEIADFFVLPPTLNPDGSFTLELSAEGRAHLEQGGKLTVSRR